MLLLVKRDIAEKKWVNNECTKNACVGGYIFSSSILGSYPLKSVT